MKKLIVLSILSAFAVLGMNAGTASAWHYNLTGKGECQEDGSFNITWKIDNTSEPSKLEIKASSNPDVVKSGDTVEAKSTKSFGQNVDGTKPGVYKLELTADWKEDRNNMKRSATVKLKEACEQPEVPEVPETPETPEEPETPQILPRTGAGSIAAVFLGSSTAAAALHNVRSRRNKN